MFSKKNSRSVTVRNLPQSNAQGVGMNLPIPNSNLHEFEIGVILIAEQIDVR